jgi:penicillin-binding protein 1C
VKRVLLLLVLILSVIAVSTSIEIQEVPSELSSMSKKQKKQYFLDRHGKPLNTTYTNRYNTTDLITLHELPPLFTKALLLSEDKNFYHHNGVDWSARLNALWQNVKALKRVRGASSISEQVIKILHPRKRTLWSKWLEGFEAQALNKKMSKEAILTFYINQIPYAANRKGVKQASLYYFNRDISTLNEREMLALIVIIRSPRWYDPFKYLKRLNTKIEDLASRLYREKMMTPLQYNTIKKSQLHTVPPQKRVDAHHFIAFVSSQLPQESQDKRFIQTTLDPDLQEFAQKTLDTKITSLNSKNVHNGAAIIIDHHTNEILAWVVAYAGEKNRHFNSYDPVLVPRQPGSTLKPFLYALALQKGWEASTIIKDTPLSEGVGLGMHSYHNYSNQHYGDITLREALGNSLNIPAIKTIQYVGIESFLHAMHRFGITTLTQHPNYYGDGIALGNSEVTLYELSRAYAVLARMGTYKELLSFKHHNDPNEKKHLLSQKVASLIGNILSDPTARAKEFGRYSILNLPHQTAIKTGTSSDYRDAWVLGFDDRYTIGVWFGNLDYQSMNKVTGSSGPAYVLKTLFSHLSKNRESKALFLSDKLIKKRLCIKEKNAKEQQCKMIDEFLLHSDSKPIPKEESDIKIVAPTKNLILAKDPRIPDEMEYYTFKAALPKKSKKVEWYLNNTLTATTTNPSFEWAVTRGDYDLHVKVFLEDGERVSGSVHFSVK